MAEYGNTSDMVDFGNYSNYTMSYYRPIEWDIFTIVFTLVNILVLIFGTIGKYLYVVLYGNLFSTAGSHNDDHNVTR